MQVIENWADVRGTIRGLSEPGDVAGFVTALIDVNHVAPVPGVANLFEQAAGQTIRVNIPQAAAEALSLRPGQAVTCRVRMGGPLTAFAHPDRVCAKPA
jgi:hypothetical protein